jgi:hypothetical protein
MNNEKREILKALFGSLPIMDGKKLKDIHYRVPTNGDTFLADGHVWITNRLPSNFESRPVAIFEDTHRPDGTPMDIDALPQDTEYIRYVYAGQYLKDLRGAERYYTFSSQKWAFGGQHPIGGSAHYMLAYKIAQPTTLEDLVGKDGQNNCWLIYMDGSRQLAVPFIDGWGDLCIFEKKELEKSIKAGTKYSSSPFTAYADANEFVV